MHDAVIGERLGLPSAGIMTSKFTSAADLMAKVLGAEGHDYAVIEHPISSASEAELAARAEAAAAECVRIMTGNSR